MTSSSSFGNPQGADNGIGWSSSSGTLQLGGDLVRPTAINTSPVNFLSLTGLTGGNPATDVMLVVDPTGAIKFIALTGLNDFWASGTGATTPDGVNDGTEAITRVGDVGIGIVDPTLIRAKLDVNGSQILRPVALANFPANAAIGTAAATVDVTSFVTINQTTAGIVVTLPNPTNTQAGRMLDVMNTGNQSVTVGGQLIAPGTGLCFIWTGAAWGALGSPVSLDWKLTGNSGTAPTAHADGGAQTGNFIGTLDNQALAFYVNAGAANGKSDLRLYPSVSAGAAIAAATDILHLRRGGQAGVVWPQIMSIALGHWLAEGNSRTRADFRLGNGAVNVPDFTLMSIFSQGGVGINGNGTTADWSWAATGGGIGRGNGGALLALMGGNSSNNVGPHIGAWTQADTFPLFYQLNWTHNNIAVCFDGYYDGTFRNAHTSRPYAIYKVGDALNIYGAAAAGAAGAAWTQDLIARFRYAGATLAGGELDFNNVVKNRRIVLFDTNAASDHQYYGFGINASTFRYQVDSVNSAHRFYAGTAAGASQELIAFLGNRQIDVNSAIILRSVAIANVLANGAVGTAATTVDISSTLVLAQTTANIALTLPNPANTTAGRVLYVTHNGTAACTVAGKALNPGETLVFIWDGNTWNPPAYVAPSNRAYVLCDAPANTAVANATATLANWTEITDAGNNHAAGIFTAPRTGLYQVSAMVTYLAAAWNANTYAQIAIAINGVDARQATSSSAGKRNRIISVNISATISLTAGQNIRINVYQNSGAAKNTTGGINSFYTIAEL